MASRVVGSPRVTLAGVWLVTVAAAAYELSPASVQPLLIDEFGIGPATASLIVGVMFGTAVVTSIPIGIGLGRVNTRYAIVGAAGLLVISGVWGWQATRAGAFRSLIASRIAGAFAFTILWNGGADLIGRSFGSATRATAIGIFSASGTAGFAIGQVAGPQIAAAFGTGAVFAAFGPVAVVGVIVFWPASRGVTLDPGGTDQPGAADFKRVLTSRRVWHVSLIAFAAYALYLYINSWMPTYLSQELGISLASSGAIVGLFAGVGILSRIGGGAISDRVFDTRRRPVVVVSLVLTTPLIAALWLIKVVPVVIATLLLSGFTIQLTIGLALAYIRELVDPSVAATAVSVLTAVSLSGAFLAPIIAGILIERTGGYEAAFTAALGVAIVGSGLAILAPEPER